MAGTLDWLEFPDWGAAPEHDAEPQEDYCGWPPAHADSTRHQAAQHAVPPTGTGLAAESADASLGAVACAMSDTDGARLDSLTREGMHGSPGVEERTAAASEFVQHHFPITAQPPDRAASAPPIWTSSPATSACLHLHQASRPQLTEQVEPMDAAEAAAGLSLGEGLEAAGKPSRCSLPAEAVEQVTNQSFLLPCQQLSEDAVSVDLYGAAPDEQAALLPAQRATGHQADVPSGKESLDMHVHFPQTQDVATGLGDQAAVLNGAVQSQSQELAGNRDGESSIVPCCQPAASTMHEQQQAHLHSPHHRPGVQCSEAAEQGVMDKAPDDQHHHHHQHPHHDHHPHQSMPAKQENGPAGSSMACQLAASAENCQVPAGAASSPADITSLPGFHSSDASVPISAAAAASQTIMAGSLPANMHLASSTGDNATPIVPDMHEGMASPRVPSAETAIIGPGDQSKMQDAPEATVKEVSGEPTCTDSGQCMSRRHDQAQPVAGGADLSAGKRFVRPAGHMHTEHWMAAISASNHEPKPSTSRGPATHQKALPARQGASAGPVVGHPEASDSSAQLGQGGKAEHDGHEDMHANKSCAGEQGKRKPSPDKEESGASGPTTNSRKRKRTVYDEPKFCIPSVVKSPAGTGSKRDRSPQQSSSSSYARHTSRRRSKTGPRSVSPAICRRPASPGLHVKEQRTSRSGRRRDFWRKTRSASSQSSLSRRIDGPRHSKVGAQSPV